MKILTWNLERLQKNKNQLILEKLAEIDADILILTETNSLINPGSNYSSLSTEPLPKDFDGIKYKATEHRTTIWSKYSMHPSFKTFDSNTSVCADIKTPMGLLTVYGTIIGVFGGRGERFNTDIQGQLADFKKLSASENICIAGDFNVTFSGYTYPSHKARETLNDAFRHLSLTNTTAAISDTVDHIVLSENFAKQINSLPETWNGNKKMSDHIGVCITLKP